MDLQFYSPRLIYCHVSPSASTISHNPPNQHKSNDATAADQCSFHRPWRAPIRARPRITLLGAGARRVSIANLSIHLTICSLINYGHYMAGGTDGQITW